MAHHGPVRLGLWLFLLDRLDRLGLDGFLDLGLRNGFVLDGGLLSLGLLRFENLLCDLLDRDLLGLRLLVDFDRFGLLGNGDGFVGDRDLDDDILDFRLLDHGLGLLGFGDLLCDGFLDD